MYPQLFYVTLALFFGEAFTQKKSEPKFFLQTDHWEQLHEITSKQVTEVVENKLTDTVYEFTLTTKSGVKVPVLFFDRNSDTVILAGQGLPAPKEAMQAFAQVFNTYDVVVFDYRWNGCYEKELIKSLLLCSPVKRILLNEEEEVTAVLEFIQKRKEYKKIVGLGECYSNFLFAKVQSDAYKKYGKGPFTHLIMDSCWYSLRLFAERILYDPFLPFNPWDGGAPTLIKKISNAPLVKWPLLKIIFTFLPNITIEDYLPSVGIPVFFIHGKKDLFVPKKHFEKIWQATQKNKRAVLWTPYQHAHNLGNKNIYKMVGEKFINSNSLHEFCDLCEEL